ncbi:MAG TPA: imidazole glycerol phosphate synthase subunit HisF [Vicinamibacterales bacterium]|nr:imidazole glycerol phosphate synthase subunit HisF [Vicinamibacterales bacterium]
MLMRRLIACLDVRDGAIVKGVRFESLRDAGDPAARARQYYEDGADELVILDVNATTEGRVARERTVATVADEIFVPLAVGGGITSLDDASAMFEAGADKVCINTAAVADPALIGTIARRYGTQAVVVSIDAKRTGAGYEVFVRSGRDATGRDAVEWAREAADRGAGELLVTAIDRDGTREGFDCELTSNVSSAVAIPVIASGGAGAPEHFIEVFTRGRADAALAASVFHYGDHPVASLKARLAAAGIPTRC